MTANEIKEAQQYASDMVDRAASAKVEHLLLAELTKALWEIAWQLANYTENGQFPIFRT